MELSVGFHNVLPLKVKQEHPARASRHSQLRPPRYVNRGLKIRN